jgi:PAS domain S-box-containing protein
MEFTKSRSQFFNALGQMTGYVRQIRRALTRLGTSVARRLQEALHAIKSDLPKLAAISLNAAAVTVAAISKQVWIRLQYIAVHLRQAQNTLIRLGRSVFDKPRRLQEVLRVRENALRMSLASSLDAIIVINGRRHFVDANPKALDLFGVSQTNMSKFTIDAFLSRGQIRKFDGNRSRFLKREAKRGKCEIRRLDGSLRVAECIYIANFVPFRHFCRFRNATETDQYRPATLRTPGSRPIKSKEVGN